MAAEKDLGTFTRGDTITLPFTFKEKSGTPIDLRGLSVGFSIKRSAYEPDSDAIFLVTKPLTADDTAAENGEVTIAIPSDVSETIIPGSYVYDLQLVAGGVPPVVQTYLYGRITFRIDVTHGALV